MKALLFCLGCAALAGAQTVNIRVDAAKASDNQIPRTIFGSFLEPIGNSTYNGLWAEILQNPSFENGLWSAGAVERMIHDDPSLAQASQLGLPLPWAPLDPRQGNRYEPHRADAANSFQSVEVIGVPDKPTGLQQQVYLPVHRELAYHGSLFVKHLSGPAAIEISLRKRGSSSTVLASASVNADSAAWQKYTFALKVPEHQVQPLESVDFVIQVQGDERALIDQASLLPDDAIGGLDPDMVKMAQAMHTSVVRFGGNFTSGYHWRDGIGPMDKRVSMRNIAWGIPELNQFGTDEFLHFCDLIGAEPQIALNLGSGTPEEAADWVRYVDEHWKQHQGLLWELGNELWGNWNLGSPTLQELPGRTLAFSKAVRAVDPSSRLIATGQDPDHFDQWNAAQLTNPPGTFNFLSTHFVVTDDRLENTHAAPDEIASADFALPVQLGRQLEKMQAQIDGTAGYRNKAHIAFTEWLFAGGHWPPRNTTAATFNNMGGAIDVGGFFNMLLTHSDVVPVSDMTGIIEFAGIWKKRGVVYGTPSYYAFKLYATADADKTVAVENDSPKYDVHRGVTRLPEIASVPYLEVVAVRNKSGDKLTLFCVNRDLNRDLKADISLAGFHAAQHAAAETLYSENRYDENNESDPESIVPVRSNLEVAGTQLHHTFRHESVTRIELTAK